MNVLTLPRTSKFLVAVCIGVQTFTIYSLAHRQHRSIWFCIVAFLIGGFVTDLISGLFHFSFDYVWPPKTPIMGPLAGRFREHHEEPTLDPSALATNLTKGAYGALPLAAITILVNSLSADTAVSFLVVASLMATSIWMLGFHQIHAYAHMGSKLPPEEFNQAVARISHLPTQLRKTEFAKLFQTVGIPWFVRILQRMRIFLRPEIHWQHHLSFETDFSSVNGWSDPVMNWIYQPLVQRIIAKRVNKAVTVEKAEVQNR